MTAKDGKQDKNPRYSFRADHDPNGIGNFYLGREIAHVMGYGPGGSGARWLERVAREREEKLSLMVKSLKIRPGDVIADINSRRGRIEHMDSRDGLKIIVGPVPLAEMFGYATDVRSVTQGRATFTMHFSRYAKVPANITEEVVLRVRRTTV